MCCTFFVPILYHLRVGQGIVSHQMLLFVAQIVRFPRHVKFYGFAAALVRLYFPSGPLSPIDILIQVA